MNDLSGGPLRANSIAIIGMAGRFPGASSIERFWSNLAGGVESITFFTDDELLEAGVDPKVLDRPDFVKAAPVLDDIDKFDASFFKVGRREAELMDPQQRIMLELAWETLERAGYAGEAHRGMVGVFVGAGGLMSSYLLSPYHLHNRLIGDTCSIQSVGNDKDYLATRISYKLDLRGPSLTVQTACSTSLVAVHLACQSLLAGECDVALAGGVAVRVPHRTGYLQSGQAMLSPDGHCRAFDAAAQGTLFGSGAGLVLLKPLVQAFEDGDRIHAVVRGSAVNNDGAAKLSYWATCAEGQAAAAADAMAVAEVEPETIGCMEAHGTATSMGDPVEVFGLTRAFRRGTQAKQFCALGSVKTNLGHLEAAAGIAGLIKAALALEHKTLPPSLHFARPNPAIDFSNTPFYVNTQCRPWKAGRTPRRAAVNSLGIGGTNAHFVLEEAPEPAPVRAGAERPFHLLTLSGKTPQALRDLAERYARHFDEHADANLADACFTANTGRGHFKHRLAVTASTAEEVRARLAAWIEKGAAAACAQGTVETPGSQVVFLFTGQGSQYAGMGRQMYESQPVFRQAIEKCDAALRGSLERSLLPAFGAQDEAEGLLASPAYAQPALFALEYALAQVWKSWGVEPSALMGHGVGEYVAACLAGVFTLEEGLGLVSAQARMARALESDRRMVAVMAAPSRVDAALRAFSADVSLAAVNSPRQVVVSGRTAAVEALVCQLRREGVRSRTLPVVHALHTPSIAPLLDDFRRACGKVQFRKPCGRIISGLTGKPAADDIATAEYWCRRLCEPVQFADGVTTLEEQGFTIFLEIGPQPRLLGPGRRSMKQWAGLWLPSLRRGQAEWHTLLSSVAQLYVHGVKIDWAGVDRGWPRRRTILPTYPFQRQRYWVREGSSSGRTEPTAEPSLLRLLQEGKAEQFVEELRAREGLSDQEARLVARVLQSLVRSHRQPSSIRS